VRTGHRNAKKRVKFQCCLACRKFKCRHDLFRISWDPSLEMRAPVTLSYFDCLAHGGCCLIWDVPPDCFLREVVANNGAVFFNIRRIVSPAGLSQFNSNSGHRGGLSIDMSICSYSLSAVCETVNSSWCSGSHPAKSNSASFRNVQLDGPDSPSKMLEGLIILPN
jgi:hypothetical protein